jgi:uncharacterized membrane protein
MTLNVFLRGWEGETNIFGLLRPRIRPVGFVAAAVVLGGMAFLNTWDFPILLTIFCSAYVLTLVIREGWAWARALDFLELAIPLGILSILLYLPFYVGFQSQAGGILPNLINPSRGAHLWVMFGPFFILLFAFLIFQWRKVKTPANWKSAWLVAILGILALWIFSWMLAITINLFRPDMLAQFLNDLGAADTGTLIAGAFSKRTLYIGGLATLLILFVPPLAFISGLKPDPLKEDSTTPSPLPFVFLLILFGTLLVIAPEFIYLKDGFGNRMNTVFKFYYQAWLMWSLAAAFGSIILWRELRGVWRGLFIVTFAFVLAMALVYAPLGFWTKTNQFNPANGLSLDASDHLNYSSPDDAAAINWLKTAPLGVVAEAVGGQYSEYARAATYAGQPNVIGWPGHEGQWRGGYTEVGSRPEDMRMLYETRIWDEAKSILDKYDVTYVYVGNLERGTYNLFEEKFRLHLPVVYEQGSVTIYVVP